MAVIKCKMCGGDLKITENVSVAECEYCGTMQTIPKADNEKKMTLFNRANRLQLACEFDKAAAVYENIVAEFPTEAEAYWGLVLCRYGIEYVDDPITGKKVPTCHRSSFDSVLEDSDFELACDNADVIARKLYRTEAKAIEEIRRGILTVSGKEEPYDIFICYKETDENGGRTLDSALAQETYDALTEKGYRVFFSRITLEDKLGCDYEPYIFAALNSAKVMLVFGTDYEYFNAVWVKNEWSRYLKLMAKDKSKHLIPCYKGIDAYDMPKEFVRLQGQDFGKIGAIKDLERGIEKLIGKANSEQTSESNDMAQTAGGPTMESFLKRGQIFLEDGSWRKAKEYFDNVLDINPECGQAYFGKFLASYGLRSLDGTHKLAFDLDRNKDFCHAEQFANGDLAEVLKEIRATNSLNIRRKQFLYTLNKILEMKKKEERILQKKEALYKELVRSIDGVNLVKELNNAAEKFDTLGDYRDSREWAEKCRQRAKEEQTRLEDAERQRIEKEKEEKRREAERLKKEKEEQERKEEEERQKLLRENAEKAERKRKRRIVMLVGVAAIAAYVFVEEIYIPKIISGRKYDNAVALMENGDYEDAIDAFEEISYYSDSKEQILQCQYEQASALMEGGEYENAISAFEEISDYSDSKEQILQCQYEQASALMEAGEYENAISAFEKISDYSDSKIQIQQGKYNIAAKQMKEGNYNEAITGFGRISDYSDAETQISQCIYEKALAFKEKGDFLNAILVFGKIPDYSDAREQINQLRAECVERKVLDGGERCTVSLHPDGTVAATGIDIYGETNVSDWTNIVAISANYFTTVGLHADGTVVATGWNEYGQCNVGEWTDIVAISSGMLHTVGLRADGTVVAVGDNDYGECDTSEWKDIVAISAGAGFTVGLHADGTVVSIGVNEGGQDEANNWSGIIAVSSKGDHVVGLRGDGTVVAAGWNKYGQCDVGEWTDIIEVLASLRGHTVGLKADGTLVTTGENSWEQCKVEEWENISSISVGDYCTFGICADGTVRAAGYNEDGECEIQNWNNMLDVSQEAHVNELRTLAIAGAPELEALNEALKEETNTKSGDSSSGTSSSGDSQKVKCPSCGKYVSSLISKKDKAGVTRNWCSSCWSQYNDIMGD
ncbi:tetratricopeptide repeat protein [Blautia sp. HCP3S3_H10_1]|uniref:tetratricopeptide repeat protein n=1 Tax=unclassified Blautia TaxID=2648079 RepID=UPI003F91C4E9